MNNTKHRWTEADHELVRAHYGKMPTTELASLIGVTLHSLHHRAKRLGVTAVIRFKGTPLAGLSDAELAAHVQALQDEGLTLVAIAKRYGVSRRNLWNICQAAGVTLRSRSNDMRLRWQKADASTREAMTCKAHARNRELWQDPAFAEEKMRHLFKSQRSRRSSIELAVEAELVKLGVDFEIQKSIGMYSADFYLPALNTVLECDGDYWHSLPEVQTRDQVRDAYMMAQGMRVIRLREKDIRADARRCTALSVLPPRPR